MIDFVKDDKGKLIFTWKKIILLFITKLDSNYMSCDFCGREILPSDGTVESRYDTGANNVHDECGVEWDRRATNGLCVCCGEPLDRPHFTNRHDDCTEYTGYYR